MLTNKIEFYITHDQDSYLVSYDVSTGVTSLMKWIKHTGEFTLQFDAPFVCENRKAAEIVLQSYIHTQKRNSI